MSRGRKRRIPPVTDDINDDNTLDMSPPDTKRVKLSKLDPSLDLLSDDNTISTTSILTPSPPFDHSNIQHQTNSNTFEPNMIDLSVEFPSLSHVLNTNTIDELALDSTFDLAQFTQNDTKHPSFPMIFNWEELSPATNPQQLRTEALRKQERGKYVRRDSLSSEEAADRRRRQNRESARRTRDRVRKYITVLEMYYSHVQKVNTLLIKQLEVMAKHYSNQLTDDERNKLKMHSWPKPPTIEECINAKPATISATSSTKQSPKTNKTTDVQETPLKFETVQLNTVNLPTLNLSCNAYNNRNDKGNGTRTSQINIMQMNHHNNMNILNQIQSINTMNNNNMMNPLRPFERELLQCGVSLNPVNMNNTRYMIRPMMNTMNSGNVLAFQAVPNNNVLAVLPTQLNTNFSMINGNGSM